MTGDPVLRFDTLTPGGHHGPTVTVHRRPDGVIVRLAQGDAAYMDVFLGLSQCEQFADVLMDVVYTAQHERRRSIAPVPASRGGLQ